MPFPQLTLTMVVGDPPGCPFLCVSGSLAQAGCPGLHGGGSLQVIREEDGEGRAGRRRVKQRGNRDRARELWHRRTGEWRGQGGDGDRMRRGEACAVDR